MGQGIDWRVIVQGSSIMACHCDGLVQSQFSAGVAGLGGLPPGGSEAGNGYSRLSRGASLSVVVMLGPA